MSEVERNHDLLVLDFGGVCTPSHRETIDAADSGGDGKPVEAITTIRPGCEAVVAAAQNHGIQVVILSNEISPDWAETIPLLNQVDRVLACTDNRIFKPDRRAFQRALLLTGCRANRSLVVDDEMDNVRSAQAIGLNTIHFDTTNPKHSWAEITQTLGLS